MRFGPYRRRMPSLVDPVLRLMRRSDSRAVGACAVCGRPVKERDNRLHLRSGTQVHEACATYRMRAERAGGRRSSVTALRHPLHVGD